MSEYREKFDQIIATLKNQNYDYKKDYQQLIAKQNNRKIKKCFELRDYVESMVFAMLSNQRPWEGIEKHIKEIKEIFHNFDPEYLENANSQEISNALKNIHCGNRAIDKQMNNLKANIETLRKIENKFGSLDNYFNNNSSQTISFDLSVGKYKLKQMGMPLVSEFVKGIGVDTVKPDVHLCRIIGRLGFSKNSPNSANFNEVFEACEKFSKDSNTPQAVVDSILWQYCANKKAEICQNKPKCNICLVKDCKFRKN